MRVTPAYVTNDGGVARLWAEAGMGLVLRSEWDAAEAVAQGTLVRVLADWRFDSAPVVLLVPVRKGRSARVRAFSEFLMQELGANARHLVRRGRLLRRAAFSGNVPYRRRQLPLQ